MSDETRTDRLPFGYFWITWVVLPVLGLGGVLLYILLGGSAATGDPERPGNADPTQENDLAEVRRSLARKTNLTETRAAVALLNQHLRKAKVEPPALPTADAERLARDFGLDKADMEEVASTSFTLLDAHHLDACFLLRDVAASLEVTAPGAGGKAVRPPPLDRARLGFEWVVRQVRLESSDAGTAPVAPVLRRGSGTALERGLIFLALLEQFGHDEDAFPGLQGCLLYAPGSDGRQRFWACGVGVGETPDAMYLFDPRLGLPLPGPGGKGVATLAQARGDATVLAQLAAGKLRYDVTAEQARAARAEVVVPLSALAPRMRHLQTKLLRDREAEGRLLGPQVRVRLAEPAAAARATVKAALKAGGGSEAVTFAREPTTLLRRFIPKQDGGSDTEDRLARFFTQAVPWIDFPGEFTDARFGPQTGLGQRLRTLFMAPFVNELADPTSPRELLLRGQFRLAGRGLVKEQAEWQQVRDNARAADPRQMVEGLKQWIDEAIDAYAAEVQGRPGAKARVERLWAWKPNEPIRLYLFGWGVAPGRLAAVAYLRALCEHERAARRQARLDLLGGDARSADVADVRQTWSEALRPWTDYINNYGGRPAAVAGRRLRGEVQARLGRTTDAVTSWQDLGPRATELERLAALWLARRATAWPWSD